MKKIKIFDTTLRDGSQRENINFSLEDKLKVARLLCQFGVDYIEGGWPSSNPKDKEFFQELKKFNSLRTKIVGFCSTRKKNKRAEKDPNLLAILRTGVKTTAIFGKTSLIQVERVIKTSGQENLKMIAESINFLGKHGVEVIFDAEHFFDGFKENPDYSLSCLKVAALAGASNLTLCDTNGGTLPSEISKIIKKVRSKIKTDLGIHAHNDSGLAVANSIAAVENGVCLVQGTINGYGERCGNADLTTVIPTLQLKMGYFCVPEESLRRLTKLAKTISEITNEKLDSYQPYVGESAFAHKGGIHVSAYRRYKNAYEHIDPEIIGNKSRILISELSGKSNLMEKFKEWQVAPESQEDFTLTMLKKIKELECQGYAFEGAEGSLKLLYQKLKKGFKEKFLPLNYKVTVNKRGNKSATAQATVVVKINKKRYRKTAFGNGPVNALDRALRKAIVPIYPELKKVELIDYKVRILNESDGTAAKVRVLITSKNTKESWTTVGVSTNIIEASWQALIDSLEYALLK